MLVTLGATAPLAVLGALLAASPGFADSTVGAAPPHPLTPPAPPANLQLRPDQQQAFVDYWVVTSKAMVAMWGSLPASPQGLTKIEALELALSNLDRQRVALEAELVAMKIFYAQLTPEQRKAFDEPPHPPLPDQNGHRPLPPEPVR